MSREPLSIKDVLVHFVPGTELAAVEISRVTKRPMGEVFALLFALEDQGKIVSRWVVPVCDPKDTGKKNYKLYRLS